MASPQFRFQVQRSGRRCRALLSLAFGLTISGLTTADLSGFTNLSVRAQNSAPAQRAALPAPIAAKVRQDLTRRTQIPVQQLRIFAASPQTWSDSCLGLGTREETCAQALVSGWRVSVASGERLWTYRTNDTGTLLRLENPNTPMVLLPGGIAQQVLANAAQRAQQDPNALTLATASRRTWPDSCLGLGGADLNCAEVLVPGWEVVVTNERQRWVYRTDQSGAQVRLDEAGSRLVGQMIQPPQRIPKEQLPPPLGEEVRFRLQASGGITGRSTETTLLADGRIVETRQTARGETQTRQVRQISPKTLAEFQQLLTKRQISRFNQLDYPAPTGSADYTTLVLSTRDTTIRFADIAEFKLSEDVQQVLKSWQKLVQRGRL